MERRTRLVSNQHPVRLSSWLPDVPQQIPGSHVRQPLAPSTNTAPSSTTQARPDMPYLSGMPSTVLPAHVRRARQRIESGILLIFDVSLVYRQAFLHTEERNHKGAVCVF
jgi:hypothetical protein